ncbi:MAG: PfaD family polyunsaturated fatty acid/polyketide biosynthesis protein [Planctomycetota bacterium]|nr:PfaD family polyunsaturated fatty acid/polyketide biosynthesis protein [Planctomycetota bacterium]
MNVCLTDTRPILGCWKADSQSTEPTTDRAQFQKVLSAISRPIAIVLKDGEAAIAAGGQATLGLADGSDDSSYPLLGYAPALTLQNLGSSEFCDEHGLDFPYVAGAMANGIASVELVEAVGKAGMLGFFGSAGLSPERVEDSLKRLKASLGDRPFGANLIHSPNEPDLEDRIVDLYLKHELRLVSASAYMGLTLPVVRYRVTGIHRNADGEIVAPNKIVAKVSRVEVATQFFSPPPPRLLKELVEQGVITQDQAELAAEIPMAGDLTAEADSGGHTDNRPAVSLVPTMVALAARLGAQFGYAQRLRVGAAGGIATPASAAAAFAMGADFLVTGTINQACIESGSSNFVRQMLVNAGQADTAMAPAADMFEMGVKVQVLKRGTMFAMRAQKLYDTYKAYGSLEEIPAAERASIEKMLLRASFEESWASTKAFFELRDPRQVERANRDPKHKMALVFRSYLGLSSRWANAGEPSRKLDYQVWCGPAMGAFNEWVKGSFLEQAANRNVVAVAMNLLYGAAVLTRLQSLRSQGLKLSAELQTFSPMKRAEIEEGLSE